LIRFYRTVRPWGFWGPIHDRLVASDASFRRNTDFGRDMFNIIVGTVWQTTLVLLPIYVVLLKGRHVLVVGGLIVLTSWILKKSWYDRLEKPAATATVDVSRG